MEVEHLKRAKMKQSGTKKKLHYGWVLLLFSVTFLLSAALNSVSERLLSALPMVLGVVVLFVIIFLGIIFDIFGLAVATAEEAPFHSMASDRVKGANASIWLIRNAEKVSSFCNDVVGDIAGIVSGSACAALSAALLFHHKDWNAILTAVLLTASAAALTVGGKAVGKVIAFNKRNQLVYFMGRVLALFGLPKEKQKNGRKSS